MAITDDSAHLAAERVGLVALMYYPEIHIDDETYNIREQAAWCLEPIAQELSEDVRAAMTEQVARTIIDPTQHRQRTISALLELSSSE